MAEVKIIYRPYVCVNGGTKCIYPNCRLFKMNEADLLSDDDYICKHIHGVAHNPNVIVKNIKNFEWNGLDAYYNWEITAGKEHLSSLTAELVRIQIDGETIYEAGEPIYG